MEEKRTVDSVQMGSSEIPLRVEGLRDVEKDCRGKERKTTLLPVSMKTELSYIKYINK